MNRRAFMGKLTAAVASLPFIGSLTFLRPKAQGMMPPGMEAYLREFYGDLNIILRIAKRYGLSVAIACKPQQRLYNFPLPTNWQEKTRFFRRDLEYVMSLTKKHGLVIWYPSQYWPHAF